MGIDEVLTAPHSPWQNPFSTRARSPSHHHLGISAIMMNAGKFLVLAVHEIAAAAELAVAAGPAEKSDAYSLSDAPALNTCADFVDPTDHLMARDSRKRDAGEDRVDGRESEWQTPHASTRMRTFPGPGFGNGRSTLANFPDDVTSIAVYVVVPILPPRHARIVSGGSRHEFAGAAPLLWRHHTEHRVQSPVRSRPCFQRDIQDERVVHLLVKEIRLALRSLMTEIPSATPVVRTSAFIPTP
jgi:hypothetical protein